ncbi:MAG: NAD(P)-dependent oxidoreductase [Dehalococcoidia bacterium]
MMTRAAGAPRTRIGIVGTGFISRHFTLAVASSDEFEVSKVLTRRPLGACQDYPRQDLLTASRDELVEASDIVLECTGDAIWATEVVESAVTAGVPVVTMNAEFHVTTGSYFVGRGIVTEAEGDQPGCIASLREQAIAMGFRPVVYGNMKGFLNRTPTPEDMTYWGAKQGISLPMVTAFTDGTKVQVEQALVANAFGATIIQPEMLGPQEDDLRAAGDLLGQHATRLGQPVSDYVLSGKLPHGVFVVAEHDPEQQAALAYYKMGDGPYYTLVRNNIFVHFEIMKTLRRVATGQLRFLDNSAQPTVSVAAIAKRALEPGDRIEQAIGSFDVRGGAVRILDQPGHIPVGLLARAVVRRPVEPGALLRMDDVELPESLALDAWRQIEARAFETVAAGTRAS